MPRQQGQLFDRDYRLVVDTIDIRANAIAFNVDRSLKQDPNTAEIKIYNLNPDHRKQLEQIETPTARLQVGYKTTELTTIYEGRARSVHTLREGPDLVTVLATGDGEKEMRSGRISKKVPKGAAPVEVIRDLVKAIGVDEGNLNEATSKLAKYGNLFSQGSVIYGSAARELAILLRSMGLEFSIQNGALQILEINKALTGTAIRLSKSTGLIEVPSVSTEKGKTKYTFDCLIIQDLVPGRICILETERLTAQVKVDKIKYSGTSHESGSWTCSCEASKY